MRLRRCGSRQTSDLLQRYPHQLSGGQQQRICLAIAFLLRPSLIVLDEPTTGLDVTTQAHVLETVRDLCRSHETAAIYVSHDLAAVAALAQRVLVMYAGRIVEGGPTSQLFDEAPHPYTRKLIGAIPDIVSRRLLEAIPGRVPGAGRPPCRLRLRASLRPRKHGLHSRGTGPHRDRPRARGALHPSGGNRPLAPSLPCQLAQRSQPHPRCSK